MTQETGDAFERMTSLSRYYDIMIFGLRSLFDYKFAEGPPTDILARLVSRGVRPVLAVAQEYQPIRRVLLAYSGSIESAKAIKRFMQMQLWPDLSLRIVTAEHPPDDPQESLANAAAYCRAFGFEAETVQLPGARLSCSLRMQRTGRPT